jgi:hypothetical protein
MARRNPAKLSIDVLEDRIMPATRFVTSVRDPVIQNWAPGQLRREINDAAPNDTIVIDTGEWGSMIRLEQAHLDINKNLTIIGMRGVIINGTSSQGDRNQAMVIVGLNGKRCQDPF